LAVDTAALQLLRWLELSFDRERGFCMASDVISIKDGRDRLVGSAIWNSKSQIVARRFSHRRQDLDLDFFKRRIAQAAEYRDRRKVTHNCIALSGARATGCRA